MSRKLTYRAFVLMLDGQEHTLSELTAFCRGVDPPEELVRSHLRRCSYNEKVASRDSYEERVRKGLELSLLESMQNYSSNGVVTQQFHQGETWYALTPSGFNSCVEAGEGTARGKAGPKNGRAAMVMAQLTELILSGEYHVKLEPIDQSHNKD